MKDHRGFNLPLYFVAHVATIQTHVNRGVRNRFFGLDEQDPECLSGFVNSVHHFRVRDTRNLILRKGGYDLLS